MSKLHCKCGHTTRLTGHSDNEFFLLNEPVLEKIFDAVDDNGAKSNEMNTIIINESHQTFRCEQCRRLYIYDEENGEEVVYVYTVEKILRHEENEG